MWPIWRVRLSSEGRFEVTTRADRAYQKVTRPVLSKIWVISGKHTNERGPCSRRRLRPLVGSHETATEGFSFLAAIAAARFVHWADRMPLFTKKFSSNGCFQQGPRRISGEPLQDTYIPGS